MRTIKKVHKSDYSPIADLITYSPLPSKTVDQIDPFLLINHHGPQTYPAHNNGLPFGPHPHRGMETVTFIVNGDIMHKDSGGHQSIISAGGIQYMRAGKGLIHAEVSSENFKKEGGNLEILQLWLNLPSKNKMAEPIYKGFQKDEIPTSTVNDGNVTISILAGPWDDTPAAFETPTNIHLRTISFKTGCELTLDIPTTHNIFFYLVQGALKVNQQEVIPMDLVEFNNDHEHLTITAEKDSLLILGHAEPFNEPVVSQGPFVMNTEAEIRAAYMDYQSGKFGVWKD